MVAKATDPNAALLEGVDIEGVLSGKAFSRQERQQIVTIAELEVIPADEDWLARRNFDFRDSRWTAMFPAGYPVLKIGLKGVNVKFAFSPDEIQRVFIPIRNPLGHNNEGKTKGRGSQLHVVLDAFKQIYGLNPLAANDIPKLLAAQPCLWGQHLGEMDDPDGGSQKREWGWDIPRTLMSVGYTYTGEVRVIEGRDGGTAAGTAGGAVGTAQMSDEESDAAVAAALEGLEASDFPSHAAAVLGIPGLAGSWYDVATGGNVAKEASDKGLIVANDDGTIGLPETE